MPKKGKEEEKEKQRSGDILNFKKLLKSSVFKVDYTRIYWNILSSPSISFILSTCFSVIFLLFPFWTAADKIFTTSR
jgi:hypothetical protein